MLKIILLKRDDFINPEKADQFVWSGQLKSGDIGKIEMDYHVVIYQNKIVKNRLGSDFDIDMLNSLQKIGSNTP